MTAEQDIHFDPMVARFISDRQAEFEQIPSERKDELRRVALYIRSRLDAGNPPRLTFICTHNSRRSHLSQIWAKIAADRYGLGQVETFSGGTEATALHPNAVATLERSGLRIDTEDSTETNPVYRVLHADNARWQECFSKVFDQPPNPTSEYCAIMTCSQADEACPVVMGCDLRAPIRYQDPKIADGTPEEAATYDERSRQICREMLFMMSVV